MSILVLLEGQVQAGKIGEMKLSLKQIFPSMRSYDGSQGLDAYFNMNNQGNTVILEQRESCGHHEKYLKWRTESGIMDKLGSMLVEPPDIRYFERADV